MVQKQKQFQGLNELPTALYDNSADADGYLNITLPDQFTSGKNLIKLEPNSERIAIGSEIMIEILDADANPVYYDVSDYTDAAGAVHIVPYIYGDTAPGYCIVTILAEVTSDLQSNPVPNQFKGKVNYKWQQKMLVSPNQRNYTPILFDTITPTITINELVKTYMDRDYGSTQYITQSAGTLQYQLINNTATIQSTGFEFNRQMIGGNINITASLLQPESPYPIDDNIYTTKISRVLSANHAVLEDRFEAPHRLYNPGYHVPKQFGPSDYTLFYETEPTYSLTENSRSFAYVDINALENISGEIYRVKTLIKSAGTVGSYEVVDDTVLVESPYREKFIDTGSSQIKTSMGLIKDQATVDSYWSANVYSISTKADRPDTVIASNPATLSFDENTNLPKSFEVDTLSGTSFGVHYIKVENNSTTNSFKNEFTKDGEYILQLDALGRISNDIGTLGTGQTYPKISIFMSGSAFRSNPGTNNVGKLVAEIDTSTSAGKGTSWRYDDIRMSFRADSTGSGVPVFVIESGIWNLGEMSMYADMDTGFNPCNATILVPLPTEQINDELDFKFEFYDSYGNLSPYSPEFRNVNTAGGNTYIGGGYNLLTGSLFVSNGLNGGVEIQGSRYGGYMRSMGYTGFVSASNESAGFMIFSGSVLPGSGDSYAGVGLELYADVNNSFKFRTDPSEFVVKTEKFYFGNSSMFISGSDGKIEIYGGTGGNDFWLQPNGQVRIRKSGSIMLDTNSGFSDARNVGRHIWSSTNIASQSVATSSIYTFLNYGANSGSVDDGLSEIGKFHFMPLSGETNLSVVYRGWSTADTKTWRIQTRLYKAITGSIDVTNPYAPYDENNYRFLELVGPNIQSRYFNSDNSPTISGSVSTIYNINMDIPTIITGSIVMGKVYIESMSDGAGTAYVDNCVVVTGRELSADALTEEIAPGGPGGA